MRELRPNCLLRKHRGISTMDAAGPLIKVAGEKLRRASQLWLEGFIDACCLHRIVILCRRFHFYFNFTIWFSITVINGLGIYEQLLVMIWFSMCFFTIKSFCCFCYFQVEKAFDPDGSVFFIKWVDLLRKVILFRPLSLSALHYFCRFFCYVSGLRSLTILLTTLIPSGGQTKFHIH